jgi:ABC-type antimicrobial peptide transport system permease subunit
MGSILDTENFTTTMVNGLPLPTRQTRRNIVVVTLLFCMTMIGYIMVFGKPENSLHQSGLSWAFMLMASVIFAYVFGAVVDNLNFWKSAKAAIPEPK